MIPGGPSQGRKTKAPKSDGPSREGQETLVLSRRNALTCRLLIDGMGSLEEGLPAVGCGDSRPRNKRGYPTEQRALDLESCDVKHVKEPGELQSPLEI